MLHSSSSLPSHYQLRETADALDALLASPEAKAPDATAARKGVVGRLQEVQEHAVAAQTSVAVCMLAAGAPDLIPQATALLLTAADAAAAVTGPGSGLLATMQDVLHRAAVRVS